MSRDEILRTFNRYLEFETAPLLVPTPERPTPHELMRAIREASKLLTLDEYTIDRLNTDLAVAKNIM